MLKDCVCVRSRGVGGGDWTEEKVSFGSDKKLARLDVAMLGIGVTVPQLRNQTRSEKKKFQVLIRVLSASGVEVWLVCHPGQELRYVLSKYLFQAPRPC